VTRSKFVKGSPVHEPANLNPADEPPLGRNASTELWSRGK
jgi:hypothetical protein